MLQIFWFGLAIALLLLAACSAIPSPQSSASKPSIIESGEVAELPAPQPPNQSARPFAAEPPAELVDAMRADLSTITDIPAASITLKSAEAVNWNDSCLGLARPDEVCLMAITPGYRIILSTPTKDYEFHSDHQRTFRQAD